jgi:type II secretory pathway pseudopilin PulG
VIAVRRLRRSPIGRDETGTTLLEILVATSVMAIIMAMFTTSVVRMYRSAQYTEAISTAQSQLTVAFGRLDRQVRYARQLSRDGVTGGYWYVEYLTDPIGGPRRCWQLRVPQPRGGPSAPAGRLETRSWVHGAQPTAFTTLASMVDPTGPSPFSQPAPGQLRVRLSTTVKAGPGQAAARRESEALFTLLNFVPDTGDVAVCAQERT